MKRVLITGKNSYVGTNVEKWLMKEPDKYYVETISLRDPNWKDFDFSKFDVVFHVAGIAHVSAKKKMKDSYYEINTNLVKEAAIKAKKEGVKQFIFMSSIIVYGNSTNSKELIDLNTTPKPTNFYGNSKLLAEKGIQDIESNQFKIVIIRSPMIYGKGSRGNYLKLSKLSKKLIIFPDFDNVRSLLHIDNLCELVRIIILYSERGIYLPQNKEQVKTSDIIKKISNLHGRNVFMTRLFNIQIRLLFSFKIIRKIFGNLAYENSMSSNLKEDYRIRSFEESIYLSEKHQ